jgi:hypothetical protein
VRIRVWTTDTGYTLTTTAVDRDDAPVLADTVLTLA